MSAILNSAILESAILNKNKLHSFILTQLDDGSIVNSPRIQPFCTSSNSIWLKHSCSTWLSGILYSASHLHKKNFTHSFSLNLMMAAILNSAFLGFSHFEFKKNFTHSFWLNSLMMAAILNSATWIQPSWLKNFTHSLDLTWWYQPSWIVPSSNQPFWTKKNVTH